MLAQRGLAQQGLALLRPKQRTRQEIWVNCRNMASSQLRQLAAAIALACKKPHASRKRTPRPPRQPSQSFGQSFHSGHTEKIRIAREQLIGAQASQGDLHS